MKFTLEIELGNTAMQDSRDLRRALHDVNLQPMNAGIELGQTGTIRDLNGNTVSKWEVSEAPAQPQRKVLIQVEDGVAEVLECPDDVDVTIDDLDGQDEEERGHRNNPDFCAKCGGELAKLHGIVETASV